MPYVDPNFIRQPLRAIVKGVRQTSNVAKFDLDITIDFYDYKANQNINNNVFQVFKLKENWIKILKN